MVVIVAPTIPVCMDGAKASARLCPTNACGKWFIRHGGGGVVTHGNAGRHRSKEMGHHVDEHGGSCSCVVFEWRTSILLESMHGSLLHNCISADLLL